MRLALLIALFVPCFASAQVIDGLIGLSRAKARNRMGELRTIGYNRDRMTFQVMKGVSQTLVFVSDSCSAYFFQAKNDKVADFEAWLTSGGYVESSVGVFENDRNKISRLPNNQKGETTYQAVAKRVMPPADFNSVLNDEPIVKEKLFEGPWRVTVVGNQIR